MWKWKVLLFNVSNTELCAIFMPASTLWKLPICRQSLHPMIGKLFTRHVSSTAGLNAFPSRARKLKVNYERNQFAVRYTCSCTLMLNLKSIPRSHSNHPVDVSFSLLKCLLRTPQKCCLVQLLMKSLAGITRVESIFVIRNRDAKMKGFFWVKFKSWGLWKT